MSKNGYSSFWTTGIWVLLRYLALPLMIFAAIYVFGGTAQRARMHANAARMVAPVQERIDTILGRSEALQSRVHLRDPDITADTGTVRLSDLPVAAIVPVVNLNDLPEAEGQRHVRLSDLPEPVEDHVYFLQTHPEAAPGPLAVATSARPQRRPETFTPATSDIATEAEI